MDFLVDCPHEASPISNVFSPNMENNKIHVMLVEHDGKHQDIIKNILRYFSYEVTTVQLATTASSMLLTGKARYDLVMASMNSSDMMSVFQLVRDAVTMNLLVVLMSNNDIDALTTMRALQQGAFLCVEKPVTMQIMECLWQHVVREKASVLEQKRRIQEAVECNALHNKDDTLQGYKNIDGCNIVTGKSKSVKKKMMGTKTSQHGGNINVVFKKKVWTQWSDELHGKFMQAVTQLGEGRCYPKEILQLMNVPGLTRMQVASHLQICRSTNWRTPGGKRPKQATVKATPPRIPKKRAPRGEIARFGSMPRPGTDPAGLLKYHHDREFMTNAPAATKRIEDVGYYNNDHVNQNSYRQDLPLFEHPFAAAAAHDQDDSCEMFNVGQFIQTFDEPFQVHAPENVQVPNLLDPTIIHSLFPLQHDLGVTNYNIQTLQPLLFDQVNHDLQIHTMTTNATKQWSQDVPKQVNGEATQV